MVLLIPRAVLLIWRNKRNYLHEKWNKIPRVSFGTTNCLAAIRVAVTSHANDLLIQFIPHMGRLGVGLSFPSWGKASLECSEVAVFLSFLFSFLDMPFLQWQSYTIVFQFSFPSSRYPGMCWVTRKVEIFEARLQIVDGNYVAMVTYCYHSNIKVLATHEWR